MIAFIVRSSFLKHPLFIMPEFKLKLSFWQKNSSKVRIAAFMIL